MIKGLFKLLLVVCLVVAIILAIKLDIHLTKAKEPVKIDTTYDVFLSNKPTRDPKKFIKVTPGDIINIHLDQDKLSYESYKDFYKENKKRNEFIEEEYETFKEVLDTDVEVYVIYSLHNGIRTQDDSVYECIYKGTLRNLDIEYEIRDEELTELQKEIMTKVKQKEAMENYKVNFVFRFTEEVVTNHYEEKIIIPLKQS